MRYRDRVERTDLVRCDRSGQGKVGHKRHRAEGKNTYPETAVIFARLHEAILQQRSLIANLQEDRAELYLMSVGGRDSGIQKKKGPRIRPFQNNYIARSIKVCFLDGVCSYLPVYSVLDVLHDHH